MKYQTLARLKDWYGSMELTGNQAILAASATAFLVLILLAWAAYEAVQADIFNHILAVIPQFGLRVYQSPTGDDIAGIIEHISFKNKENSR
jgi:hypothetical protein